MIHKPFPRSVGKVLVVTTLVTGMTVGFASGASADDAPPAEGKSCTFSEIGDELFTIKSASLTPVVTHFTSFYVAPGTNSSNTYRLNVVDRVSTSINGNTNISNNHSDTGTRNPGGDSGNAQTLFDQVSRTVGFGVRTDEATTSTQDASVQWRFNSPGYYGLYKGTMRVSGTFSRAVCNFGWKSPRYQILDEGTYSTFGPVEEGTVGCSDALPAGTVRNAAQAMLRCGDSAPAAAGAAGGKAPANAAAALPH
jgi:hypothetical protein